DEVEDDNEDENSDVEPYVVCDGVSVDAFNEFVGDGEGLRIGLRFLELSADGRVLVVDFALPVHEVSLRMPLTEGLETRAKSERLARSRHVELAIQPERLTPRSGHVTARQIADNHHHTLRSKNGSPSLWKSGDRRHGPVSEKLQLVRRRRVCLAHQSKQEGTVDGVRAV
ncbi:TPA: hypothetical protein N0F65_004671, partial [Lagenidium giganteum]